MDYYKFLDKQNRIYDEFRDISKIKVEGLKPNIQEDKGGYIIALRHSNSVINNINKITTKIYNEVDCIEYNEDNIHTTLAVYGEEIGFRENISDLEKLYNIVKSNISLAQNIIIKHDECLMNQDSVIVAGQPNQEFINYINSIENEANRYEIKIKRPWGAHITVGRFLNNISNEKILKLLNIIGSNIKIKVSKPRRIDIGYYKIDSNKFNLYIYKSIEL